MSFWVYLQDSDGGTIELDKSHKAGGTYAIGGSNDAELNVTYNYTPFYYKCLNRKDGLRWLHGKSAGETVTRLRDAVEKLGTKQADDYWAATRGNAGHALSILLAWAVAHPNATWEVS